MTNKGLKMSDFRQPAKAETLNLIRSNLSETGPKTETIKLKRVAAPPAKQKKKQC